MGINCIMERCRYSNVSLMDNNKHVLSQICFEPGKESSDINVCTSGVPVYSLMLYFRCIEAIISA